MQECWQENGGIIIRMGGNSGRLTGSDSARERRGKCFGGRVSSSCLVSLQRSLKVHAPRLSNDRRLASLIGMHRSSFLPILCACWPQPVRAIESRGVGTPHHHHLLHYLSLPACLPPCLPTTSHLQYTHANTDIITSSRASHHVPPSTRHFGRLASPLPPAVIPQ